MRGATMFSGLRNDGPDIQLTVYSGLALNRLKASTNLRRDV
jgi:hypothetical protein